VIGLCGGYQMLGKRVSDPHGIEGDLREMPGLGLLDIETTLSADKVLRHVTGDALGEAFEGYEMHLGESAGPDCARPFALLDGNRPDGAMSADGRVLGSYVHGQFASTGLRRALLERIGTRSEEADHAATVDAALDEIARDLESHLDIAALAALAGLA